MTAPARGARRVLLGGGLVAALVAVGIALPLATGRADPSTAAAPPAPVQAPCAEVLLGDWADGRIDGSYPVACYRVALRTLPVDLQVYSSAPEDISLALSRRIAERTRPG